MKNPGPNADHADFSHMKVCRIEICLCLNSKDKSDFFWGVYVCDFCNLHKKKKSGVALF